MSTETPGYYSILPSLLSYDKRFKPNVTLFGRSVQTIINLKNKGKIPYFQIGRFPIFSKKHLTQVASRNQHLFRI